MDITRKNGIPKYIQLKDALLSEIRSGSYVAGDKFHTEKELMSKYNLSYATVTHALKDMVKEGFFVRKKSLGTFITEHGVGREGRLLPLLYINDISYLCSKEKTPLTWQTYDQFQKGIINNYNGAIKIAPIEEILDKENINAILVNPENILKLKNAKCKYIVINLRQDINLDFNSVSRDVLASVYALMTYLVRELGHKKIGFIGGNTVKYHSGLYAGYEIALRTHNIPYMEERVIRGLPGTEEDGFNAMKKLLSLPNPPTAVFADTDIKAFGAIKAIQDAGLKTPDDVSVIGFGNIAEAESFNPPLTTVNVPFYEMGKRAVELLLERIHSNADIETEILKSNLLKRESCSTLKAEKELYEK